MSSFPSILATLQHLYEWDQYDFTHMQGGRVGVGEVVPPATYEELKAEVTRVFHQARSSLSQHPSLP